MVTIASIIWKPSISANVEPFLSAITGSLNTFDSDRKYRSDHMKTGLEVNRPLSRDSRELEILSDEWLTPETSVFGYLYGGKFTSSTPR